MVELRIKFLSGVADLTGEMEAIQTAASGFFLINEETGEQYALHEGVVLGRNKGDIKFPLDPRMSGEHARIMVSGTDVFIEDLKSRNGTVVNSKPIDTTKPTRIFPGDMIQVGNSIFCLGRNADVQLSASVVRPREETDTIVLNENAPQDASVSGVNLGDVTPTPSPVIQFPKNMNLTSGSAAHPPSNAHVTQAPHTVTTKTASVAPSSTGLLEQFVQRKNGSAKPIPAAQPDFDRSEILDHPGLWMYLLLMIAGYVLVSFKSGDLLHPDTKTLLHLGANYAPRTIGHGWWRLFASTFVHSSPLHLFIDFLLIWQSGIVISRLGGTLSFLSVALLSQTAVATFAVWLQPDVVFVGSSLTAVALFSAAILAQIRNPDLRSQGSRGVLVLGVLIMLCASFHTAIREPKDYYLYAMAFSLGAILNALVLPSEISVDTRWWMRIIRPLAATLVVGAMIGYGFKQLKPVVDGNDQLVALVDELLPILHEHDRLRSEVSAGKLQKAKFIQAIDKQHLPALKEFEKQLETLPKFYDAREEALTNLKTALHLWMEGFEKQGLAASISDPALQRSAVETEALGFQALDKSIQTLQHLKDASQSETRTTSIR